MTREWCVSKVTNDVCQKSHVLLLTKFNIEFRIQYNWIMWKQDRFEQPPHKIM